MALLNRVRIDSTIQMFRSAHCHPFSLKSATYRFHRQSRRHIVRLSHQPPRLPPPPRHASCAPRRRVSTQVPAPEELLHVTANRRTESFQQAAARTRLPTPGAIVRPPEEELSWTPKTDTRAFSAPQGSMLCRSSHPRASCHPPRASTKTLSCESLLSLKEAT